jgi:hypothetical protein
MVCCVKYFTCKMFFSGGDRGGGEDEIMVVKVVVEVKYFM